MAKKTQYILDALKSSGPKTPVKVIMNGVVTMASAGQALKQLHKPNNARLASWVGAEPFCESIVPVIQEPIVEKVEPTIIEESTEEVITLKRKKKPTDETYES